MKTNVNKIDFNTATHIPKDISLLTFAALLNEWNNHKSY